ncbi:flagellar hook-basal body complex protein [Meridianimarinicoccus sp. MJW13]|uniref:flagellar hook-basal body complex protein n=1 Tax=Meridianimarinicoccus sp. MJW13 TaxID=2720031 RepID=UPI0018673A03|nr:flagellar hook-basal body complex protein [Fluviibacterium sp. MJW13]
MDHAAYATLTRQTGLRSELHTLAHNVANVSTVGFQREALIFSEYVERVGEAGEGLSMAAARARLTDRSQGQLVQTGGQFDLAIEGEGYFLVDTPDGQQLTRSGSFAPNADGELVAPDGARLLDSGRAAVFIPDGVNGVHIASDGSLSVDGTPLGEIGLFVPNDPVKMNRAAGSRFSVDGEINELPEPRMAQGFLEQSNVDPVLEISRLIEVQRAYETGRNFLNAEDDRIRNVIRTLSS